jgi:hypothetical protein
LAGGSNSNNNLANLSVELLGFGDTSTGSEGSSKNSKDKEEDKEKN